MNWKDEKSFGLTNDLARYQAAVAYRTALEEDGWSSGPLYKNESSEFVSVHERDGFTVHIISRVRDPGDKWKYQASISIWGPDELAICPPDLYDWEHIKAGVRCCNECGAEDVDTHRFSFAGRCCSKCLPKMRAEHEKPGWCD